MGMGPRDITEEYSNSKSFSTFWWLLIRLPFGVRVNSYHSLLLYSILTQVMEGLIILIPFFSNCGAKDISDK
jgi:hypothetical protein